MAKKKAAAREFAWLQCSECGDLNYRTSVNTKGGMPEGLKDGLRKFCPRTRKHTLHKVKRK
jgi:large subunit ribosomal protein L33